MEKRIKKQIVFILILTIVLAIAAFATEYIFVDRGDKVIRNDYGEGKKTEQYEVWIEGEKKKEQIEVEIQEQEYTKEEIKKIFGEIPELLDKIVLGENESFDKIENNLNFVKEIEEYPVYIEWELDSYNIINLYGEIIEENLSEQGTLVEIRANISYGDEKFIYVRHANVYPRERSGTEKLLYDIQARISEEEKNTRRQKSFCLPSQINGKELTWSIKKQNRWVYILILGMILSFYLIYKEADKVKKKKIQRNEELLREYPGLISKFTMLLETGATVRNAWEKIVENYELQKKNGCARVLYDEMAASGREMQSGISEAEVYENFGKRCGIGVYMKFGTLLSQNLRKGSKGLSEMLRMEAIQSFEARKSTAKRLGEEAGTKLLAPMIGMLTVVFIMVMVPAFLSMQL